MQIKLIITLTFAFFLVLFGIFNSYPIEINVFGFKDVSTPLAFFVFVVFLAGGIFAGLLSFFDQVKQSITIRRLKKKIRDMKESLEEDEKVSLTRVPDSQEFEKEEDPESLSIIKSNLSRLPINDESKLTPAEREIALRKIKEK